MRPKPRLWLRLPHTVYDARSLAAYLREYADTCSGRPEDWPQLMLREAAGLLDGCQPADADCMRRVVAALDALATTAPDDPAWGERRYWDSVAHAVDRVADAVGLLRNRRDP
ncbi:MAG: hypothetical protein ABS52_11165 [Gemmatimonadetes bacterium SCN 70-22]|nr:MAG: hypothetical protein ABS52_11165 [Gemmatimonadetes bacterium SCN 70-22]